MIVAWSAWCSENGLQALPADPEALAAFIDAMAVTKATATIRRYISSIAHLHRAAESAPDGRCSRPDRSGSRRCSRA